MANARYCRPTKAARTRIMRKPTRKMPPVCLSCCGSGPRQMTPRFNFHRRSARPTSPSFLSRQTRTRRLRKFQCRSVLSGLLNLSSTLCYANTQRILQFIGLKSAVKSRDQTRSIFNLFFFFSFCVAVLFSSTWLFFDHGVGLFFGTGFGFPARRHANVINQTGCRHLK